MQQGCHTPLRNDSGFVVFMFMLLSVLLITSVAFAVDIARAYDEQRQLQIVADAAALSAVGALSTGASYTNILSTVTAIAQANAATVDEVLETAPRCGSWKEDEFVPSRGQSCPSSANAVEVHVQRTVPAQFANVLGKHHFELRATAVAHLPPPEGGNCIRPFGIEQSHLDEALSSGQATFSISGTQTSGNWGKIDIYGNSSSGTEYTTLMLNNVCDEAIAAGKYVSVGTGSAQIDQVFQALLEDTNPPLAGKNMVFAVTSDFGNGNSQVQIQRFIKVDLLSQEGSGPRWRANFRIVEWDAQPEAPVAPSRRLMK